MVLLSLYKAILVPILSEWVQCNALCCLDTAVCNHSLRNGFLCLLTACPVFICVSEYYTDEIYFWAVLRGLKLSKIKFINGLFPVNDVKVKLLSESKHLQHLRAPVCGDLIKCVEATAISIECLELTVNTVWPPCPTFLMCIKNVRNLDISSFEITQDFYPRIVASAPNLECISLQAPNLVGLSAFGQRQITVQTCNLGLKLRSSLRYTVRRVTIAAQILPLCTIKVDELHFELVSLIVDPKHSQRDLSNEENLRPYLPRLTTVQGPLSSRMIQILGRSCNSLTQVSLQYDRQDELYLFEFMACSGQSIKKLEVTHLDGIWDFKVIKLALDCPNLEVLDVSSAKLTHISIAKIQQFCPRLVELTTGFIVDITEKWIPVTASVESVCFQDGGSYSMQLRKSVLKHFVCDISLSVQEEFFASCPGLRNVTFQPVLTHVTDQMFEYLVKHCRLLQSVRVSGIRGEATHMLPLSHCSSLTSLELCFSRSFITDSVMTTILMNKPLLTQLILHHCLKLTGVTLHAIVLHCPVLRRLTFNCNSTIPSSDFVQLLQGCPTLLHLDIARCSGVTSDILVHLKSRQMRYVNLSECKISKTDVLTYAFEAKMPASRFVHSFLDDIVYKSFVKSVNLE